MGRKVRKISRERARESATESERDVKKRERGRKSERESGRERRESFCLSAKERQREHRAGAREKDENCLLFMMMSCTVLKIRMRRSGGTQDEVQLTSYTMFRVCGRISRRRSLCRGHSNFDVA